MLLKQLIEAKFTLISVKTDDPSLAGDTLTSLLPDADIKPFDPKVKNQKVSYALKSDPNDVEVRNLTLNKQTVILVNYTGTNPAVFDAGELPTPKDLIRKNLLHNLKPEQQNAILDAVDGLSYRRAKQLIFLAEVRNTPQTLQDYKNIRFELYGMDEGLYPMPALEEDYKWDSSLLAWAETNIPYLLKGDMSLAPRGLLLHGEAGTGKTMAVKALSKMANVPAYRLDIGASLSKWSGESEARIRKHLAQIELESPCILLIDEVEKVIKTSDDDTISTRILAQLLWWMAEHRHRVLTVLTSNDKSLIPPELYREGRCDAAFEIQALPVLEAQKFAKDWVNSFTKKHKQKLSATQAAQIQERIVSSLSGNSSYSPAVSVQAAKQAIKSLKLLL